MSDWRRSTTAGIPAGTCHLCGGQLYENLVHGCSTGIISPLPQPLSEPTAQDLATDLRAAMERKLGAQREDIERLATRVEAAEARCAELRKKLEWVKHALSPSVSDELTEWLDEAS